jgi:hypothetical protein
MNGKQHENFVGEVFDFMKIGSPRARHLNHEDGRHTSHDDDVQFFDSADKFCVISHYVSTIETLKDRQG